MSSQIMEAIVEAATKCSRDGGSGQPNLQPAASREVLRCSSCKLVQFRTASNLCRRCAVALPLPEWELVKLAAEAAARQAAEGAKVPEQREESAGDGRTSIGPRLKALREARHMTQSEIAAKASVPRTYISRIEHSHLTPGLLVVRRLAEALHVGVLDLFTDHAEAGAGEQFIAGGDYWNTFVAHFRTLQPAQQATVLAAIRGMLRQRILQQRVTEYHSFSRRAFGYERRSLEYTSAL